MIDNRSGEHNSVIIMDIQPKYTVIVLIDTVRIYKMCILHKCLSAQVEKYSKYAENEGGGG